MVDPIPDDRLREIEQRCDDVKLWGDYAVGSAMREILRLRAVVRRLLAHAPNTGGHCGWCDGCPDGKCNEGCANRDCPGTDAVALLPTEEGVARAGE